MAPQSGATWQGGFRGKGMSPPLSAETTLARRFSTNCFKKGTALKSLESVLSAPTGAGDEAIGAERLSGSAPLR